MSIKVELWDVVWIGSLGYAAWTLFGIARGDGLLGGARVARSGTVTLAPRVPYRLTFETDVPLASVDETSALRAELLPFSPYDVAITTVGSGRSLVSYSMLPAYPIPISIGARLSADGRYAPSLTLTAVERLDGKAIG